MQKLLLFIDKVSTWVGQFFSWLIVGLTVGITWEVFSRYVLDHPHDWMFDAMIPVRHSAALTSLVASFMLAAALQADPPKLHGVREALQEQIDHHEIAGAVTLVVSKDRVLHLETTGFADVASRKPMQPDTVFWIASMTKPITAALLMMLVDEGKVTMDARFREDLEADSLDLVELIMELEEEFDIQIPQEEVKNCHVHPMYSRMSL